jgi:putative ABC transport system substrate-binding protein
MTMGIVVVAFLAARISGSPPDTTMRFALKSRLPSMYQGKDAVYAGGLMSYGADLADSYRRVAYYVDRILKGTKPADIPVEQLKKFEFVINLKTAKQIGRTIPPNVLARADRVIK